MAFDYPLRKDRSIHVMQDQLDSLLFSLYRSTKTEVYMEIWDLVNEDRQPLCRTHRRGDPMNRSEYRHKMGIHRQT